MDSVEQFAAEALRFEQWAHSNEPNAALAARTALLRISSLYTAALQLPSPYTYAGDGQPCPDVGLVDECAKLSAFQAIPFDMYGEVFNPLLVPPVDMYGEVFNPLLVPPDEPVIGSIDEDITDIYRDVVAGLRAYQTGNRAGAIWEWGFHFHHHWGKHATGAIKAIHAWLVDNEFNRSFREPS